jgi:ParB-like chromosome segregation protein Spo0J
MQEIDVESVKARQDYLRLFPRPSDEEYASLKEDIRINGIHYPLAVNGEGVLLDGYSRLRAAQELGLKSVPVLVRLSASQEDELTFVIRANVLRRQLNNAQKAELGLKLLEIEKAKARARMLAGKGDPRLVSDQGRALDLAAERVGVSRDTLYKALKVKETSAERPEIAKDWKEALAGKATVNAVYTEAFPLEPVSESDPRPEVIEARVSFWLHFDRKIGELHSNGEEPKRSECLRELDIDGPTLAFDVELAHLSLAQFGALVERVKAEILGEELRMAVGAAKDAERRHNLGSATLAEKLVAGREAGGWITYMQQRDPACVAHRRMMPDRVLKAAPEGPKVGREGGGPGP